MKKFDSKVALAFGIGMFVFLLVQNFLTIDSFTTKSFIKSLVVAFISSLLAGVVFGFIVNWLKSSKQK
jgi:ABC-type antimicrobial peptide transport system permease subunit